MFGEENIMGCENRGVPYVGKNVGLPDVIMNSSSAEAVSEGKDAVPGLAGGLDTRGQIEVEAGAVEISSDGNSRAVTHKPGEDLEISIFRDGAAGLLTIIRGAIVAIAAKTPAPWRDRPVPPAGRRGGVKACAKAAAQCGDGSDLVTGLEKTCAVGTICNRVSCKCEPDLRCTDPVSTCSIVNPAAPRCPFPQRCTPQPPTNEVCSCTGPMLQASFDSEDFSPSDEVEEDTGSERAVSAGSSAPSIERGGLGGTWYQVYDYPGSYIEVSEDGQYLSWYAWGTWQLFERKVGNDYRLIQESDPSGQVTNYEWANGKLVRGDFPGSRIDYVYGANKLSINFSRCDAKHQQCVVQADKGQEYEFNQYGQLTKARGDYLPGYVDVNGTTISAPKNDGVEYRYEYDNSGKLYEVYVKRGNELLVVRYGYDNLGRLVQTTDATGRTVDYTYPSSREVVATSNQSVSRFGFDTENRIIDVWSQPHPSEPYSRVKIDYTGPGCDKRVHKYEVDNGSGNFVTAAINDWSTDENRLLRSTSYAPDGTPIVTTYNEYTEKIDGNQPQEITIQGLGTSTIEYSFKPAKDKRDARLLVDSVKSTSFGVTDIEGKKSVIESFVKLNDFGHPQYTELEGLVAEYIYDDRGLVREVLSGPASGAAGKPDMSDRTSYRVSVERDQKTDDIVNYSQGSGASQLVTSSRYEKGALVERTFPGGGKTTYRYNWFGDIAAEEVLALNEKGQPFAPGARTKYTNLMEVDEYGRVKQLSSDIGDPTKAVAEYSSISYERDGTGKIIRVVPSIGEATWYGYVGNVLKEMRIGGASGTLIKSISSTPTSQTVRQLLGANGQLNYVDVVSRFNQYGDLIEKESVQFNRKVVFNYDRFGRADGTKQFIGTNLVSEARIRLDEFGRAIEGLRVNPKTNAVDVISKVKYAGSRVAATYDIFDNPTIYNYDRGGALESVKSNTAETFYDYALGAGVVSKVTHKTKDLTSIVSYKYTNGRVSEEQYLGNGSGSTKPLFKKFFYDTLGRVIGVTDQTGRTYRQIVGPDGFLWASNTDELTIAWKRAMDSATGQVTVKRFVNNEPPTTQIFNKFGLIKHVDFDGKTTEVTYNSVGDRESIRYPDGMIAGVSRDNRNRVTQVFVPDATGVTNWVMGFDSQDLVNKVTKTRGSDVSEMEVLARGDFGEVTKAAWGESGRAPVVASFNYKAPNGITIPGLSFGGEIGGVSISKDIDLKTGELKSLKYAGNIVPGGEVDFKMDGNTLQYPAPTNLRVDWNYNEFGLLGDVMASQNNQVLHGAKYTYNSSMQTAKVEKVNGDGYAYEYHGSRLVKATNLNTNKTTEIAYDPKYPQRRTKMTRADGSVVNYQYDKIGRLVALDVGGAVHQLSYDVLGRVTEIKIIGGDTWNYIYDTNGYNPKPAEVKKNGAVVRTFEYDLNGNLKSTSANGQQEHYLNLGTGRLGKVNPANGLLSELNVNFPGIPTEIVAILKGLQSNFLTHDHQFTTERAFDVNGNLVEQYENNLAEEEFRILTPAGAQINSSAIGYDAGFHNLRAFTDGAPSTLGPLTVTPNRVGTPLVGFLSEDELDTAGDRRSRHGNNPVDRSDPTGLQASMADIHADINIERQMNDLTPRYVEPRQGPGMLETFGSWIVEGFRRQVRFEIELARAQSELAQGAVKQAYTCVYVNDWTSSDNSWVTNTVIATGQRLVQATGIAVVAVPAGAGLVAAAPVSGPMILTYTGVGLTAYGAVNTAGNIFVDGFTPQNTADTFLLVLPGVASSRRLLCSNPSPGYSYPASIIGEPLRFPFTPVAPVRSSSPLWFADDFVTTPAARRAPAAMEGAAAREFQPWVKAECRDCYEALEINYLMNSGASREYGWSSVSMAPGFNGTYGSHWGDFTLSYANRSIPHLQEVLGNRKYIDRLWLDGVRVELPAFSSKRPKPHAMDRVPPCDTQAQIFKDIFDGTVAVFDQTGYSANQWAGRHLLFVSPYGSIAGRLDGGVLYLKTMYPAADFDERSLRILEMVISGRR